MTRKSVFRLLQVGEHYAGATSTRLSNLLAAGLGLNVARSMARKLEEASRRHVAS